MPRQARLDAPGTLHHVMVRGIEKRRILGGAISFAYMNNVLIVAFSSQFFGPLSPALAAFYMLPFFSMIVPARIVGQFMK